MLPSEVPVLHAGRDVPALATGTQLVSAPPAHGEVSLDSPALGPAQLSPGVEVSCVTMSALGAIPEGRTGSGDGAPASGPSWEPHPELGGSREDPEC